MLVTQNETDGIRNSDCRMRNGTNSPSAFRLPPSAFTLVELLVVITIIGILAGLITNAAIKALENAKRAAIIIELKNIGGAMDDLKNDLGAYPPNGMNNDAIRFAENDYVRMFKKAFPRSQEPPELINALASMTTMGLSSFPGGAYNVTRPQMQDGSLEGGGLTGAEALYFWLGGFSSDVAYPISGPGGPSFADGPDGNNTLDPTDEVLEDRNLRYEFDLGRLFPRNTNGVFDDTNARFITYNDPRVSPPGTGPLRRINLWVYAPSGSALPIAYFDTSRHTPEEYDLPLSGIAGGDIYALKKFREGVTRASTSLPTNADLRFLEDKKFQILHCGTDDIWGDQFANFHLNIAANGANAWNSVTLVPEGPFLGDVADTLGSFMPGTLEEKQE